MKQYNIVLDSHILTFGLKHLLNAIIYAHIAVVIATNGKVAKLLHSAKYFKPQSLKKKFTHQLTIIFVTAGLVLAMFNLYNQTKEVYYDQETQKEVLHAKIEGELNSTISSRISAMKEVPLLLSVVWNDDKKRFQHLLNAFNRLNNFSTMILANKDGLVIDFLPLSEKNKIDPQEPISVSDREYFNKAMDSKIPYVSSGFQGRGLGQDLIAVISSGIPSQSGQQNIGIIQGSMILGEFEELKNLFNYSSTYTGLLVDQNNKVLFASSSLDINELDHIKLNIDKNDLNNQKAAQLEINSILRKDAIYYYKESNFNWGWKLITLQDDQTLAYKIELLLLIYSIALLIMALLSEIGAAIISQFWTRQLTHLATEIKQFGIENNSVSNLENSTNLPEELSVLYKAIEKSKRHVNSVNTNLKEIVNSKTKELQQANTSLKILANQDYLTTLFNRRYFNHQLKEIWKVRRRNKQLLSIMIIDIDFFKKVNDQWGHPVGDEVLKQVANYLINFKNDRIFCISRIGGEEFGIISLEYSHTDTEQIAQSIQTGISHKKIQITDKNIKSSIDISVSIGVASIDASKDSYDYLYKLADKALYKVKKSGRNCVKSINHFN